jgi:hypothetical protein
MDMKLASCMIEWEAPDWRRQFSPAKAQLFFIAPSKTDPRPWHIDCSEQFPESLED